MDHNIFDEKPIRRHRRYPSWIGGAILIFIGVIFLLQETFGINVHNAWAFFLFIPTIAACGTAWSIYQNNGHRLTRSVTGPLIGGLIPAVIGSAFLLDLDLGTIWPFFLIFAGLGVLLTRNQEWT